MATRYEINGWFKSAEIDNFEDGCQTEGGTSAQGSDRFSAESIVALVEQLRQFVPFVTESDSIQLNSCGELGRIDVFGMETDDANEPTAEQLAQWKAGLYRLWYVTYTFTVERVTREIVTLEGEVP